MFKKMHVLRMLAVLESVAVIGAAASPPLTGPGGTGELECVRVGEECGIDAPPETWSKLPHYDLTPSAELKTQGPAGLSGQCSLAWNRRYFFVIAHVHDRHFCPGDSMSGFYNYDSVQFVFSSPDLTQNFSYGASDLPFGPKAMLVSSTAGFEPGVVEAPFKAIHDGNTMTYIVALPWKLASCLDPLSGRPFRFNLIVNDNDGAKRLGWLQLTDGIGDGLDVQKFRVMRFSPIPQGPAVHVSVQRCLVAIPGPARLQVSAVGLGQGSSLRLQAGQVCKIIPLDGKQTAFTEEIALDANSPEQVLIEASMTDRSGTVVASDATTVMTSCGEHLQARLAQAGGNLAKIERRLAGIRKGGRSVDYFGIRAACVRHAIEVAKIAAGSGNAAAKSSASTVLYENSAAYAKQASLRLLAEAEAFAGDAGKQQPAIPKVNLQVPWSVRQGDIYAGEAPVTLLGFVWLYGHKDTSYSLYDIGMNMQTVDVGPSGVIGKDGKRIPDIRKVDAIAFYRRACLFGLQKGEIFELHTSPHYVPAGFKADNHNAWMGTDAGKNLLSLTYQALAEGFGDLACIRAADLANEWLYWSTSPESMSEFRDWLKDKHTSIERLNQLWQTKFSSFDEIPSPFASVKDLDAAPKGVYQPLEPEGLYRRRAPYWDWCCFNTEQAAGIVKWMQQEFKKSHPQLLTQIKCVLSSLAYRSLANNFMLGIDPEKILPVTDFIGTDASYIRGGQWKSTLMVYDYLKSICPEKPIVCTESHAPPYSDALAPGEIRRGLFQRFVHGERLSLAFLNVTFAVPQWWTASMEGQEMNSWNIGANLPTFESLSITAADLRRLAVELGSFNRRPADVLIFYDNAADFGIPGSDRPQGRYADQAQKVYDQLLPLDVKCGFVTEKMLGEKLPTAKVIILAGAEYVSDHAVDALSRFVKKGGKLILLADNFTFDPYGVARREIPWLPGAASSVFKMTGQALDALPKVLAEAGVEAPFKADLSSAAGANLEILSASLMNGKKLVFIANANATPVQLALRERTFACKSGVDLISGDTVATGQFVLAGNGVMLIELEPHTQTGE